jgi:hypothetical protein
MRRTSVSLIIFLLCTCSDTFSQKTNDKLKVFLDCTRSWLCDFDYVRTEMKMVEFVRDRFQSDVHVLVNIQNSSTGGQQSELNFLGQGKFSGLTDTLTYFCDPTTTDDDKRKQLVHYLKLGLTRFIAKKGGGKDLEISFKDTETGAPSVIEKDRWNYWVFQFGTNGNWNGNQNYRSSSAYGYFNADRETENIRTDFYISFDQNKQVFTDQNGESKFKTQNYNSGLQVAKSINAHWSYGFNAAYQNSLYSNIKAGFTLKPKVEYSIFPYKKFNSERIVIQYLIGGVHNNYYDTTVNFKTDEWQLQQSLNVITSFTKPWGSINVGIFYSNYFEDLKKNNLGFNGAVSWRITKGLNFGVYGNYSLIHDQIALRKGNFSRDELLIRNRELQSSYDYNLGIGFSYRFGSINNSIVNPRFKGLNYSVSF